MPMVIDKTGYQPTASLPNSTQCSCYKQFTNCQKTLKLQTRVAYCKLQISQH